MRLAEAPQIEWMTTGVPEVERVTGDTGGRKTRQAVIRREKMGDDRSEGVQVVNGAGRAGSARYYSRALYRVQAPDHTGRFSMVIKTCLT